MITLARVLPPLLLGFGALALRDEADMRKDSDNLFRPGKLGKDADEAEKSNLLAAGKKDGEPATPRSGDPDWVEQLLASGRTSRTTGDGDNVRGHDMRAVEVVVEPTGEINSSLKRRRASVPDGSAKSVVVLATRGVQPQTDTILAQSGSNSTADSSRRQCAIGSRCGTFSWCFPDPAFAGPVVPEVGICMWAISVPVIIVLLPMSFAAAISAWLMMQRWNEVNETTPTQDVQEKIMAATNMDRERCQTVIDHLYGGGRTPEVPQSPTQKQKEEVPEVIFSRRVSEVFGGISAAVATWAASPPEGRRCWRRNSRGFWHNKNAPQISNGT